MPGLVSQPVPGISIMRIFISNVDGHVGQALCADLRNIMEKENRILGTLSSDDAEIDGSLMKDKGVARVISRDDWKKYIKSVLSCTLIVYDLHAANFEEVERVIKELKLAKLEHDTVFILISSVNVWARTKKDYVVVRGGEADGDQEEEDLMIEESGDIGDGERTRREVKRRPSVLTSADLNRRIPSPAYETNKYLEMLALSLAPKEKLRPHVIAAGILYGNGERTFNDIFRMAWFNKLIHPIIGSGDNYIPCVHVRDVARLVRVAAQDASVDRYLIAVDGVRLTQAEIIRGIVDEMSDEKNVCAVSEDEVDGEFKDVMMLDLILEPSPPLRSRDFAWWCRNGIVANIKTVAGEFCKWRNLRPIKAVVIGPPGSGAEHFCAMIAEKYLHDNPPHLTFDKILEDALQPGSRGATRLQKKVHALSETPGAKLPLKIRTKLVKARLLTNLCRYRGYVLEGYPQSFEEAEDLFTELEISGSGDEGDVDEDDDEDEDEDIQDGRRSVLPQESDVDEEEEELPVKRKLHTGILPEFVTVLQSSEARCKTRIFKNEARGATTETEFVRKNSDYKKANLSQDGSPGTCTFFIDFAGLKVLNVDVDNSTSVDVFRSICTYMESRGEFFNYLKSEEECVREHEVKLAHMEQKADEMHEQQRKDVIIAEATKRAHIAEEEVSRLSVIAESEAQNLDMQALPLRQYLMINVVPTLAEGLIDICRKNPEDPIAHLAEYLFAHAQDIAPQLEGRSGEN